MTVMDSHKFPEGMLYLPNSNAVFLHIPKTGGTWVRSILHASCKVEVVGYSHIHHLAFARKELTANAQPFCFVRHPATWLQSYWADRQIVGWGGDLPIAHDCQSDDFNEFATKVETEHPGYVGELFAKYTGAGVWVGKFENLSLDLNAFLLKLNEPADLALSKGGEPLNVCSKRPDLANRCIYRPEVWDLVAEKEREAIERYGY